MKPRILQVIPTFERGGAEKQLLLLAAGLPRERYDLHVCALTRGGPLQEAFEERGIATSIIGKRWKVDPRALWRLTRFMREWQPDIVHTWLLAGNTYGRLAACFASVPHIIAGERCVDLWKSAHEFVIDRWLARYTNRIVVNSSGVHDFLVEHGIAPKKITLIPNGIEAADAYEATPDDRAALLAHLGLPADAVLITAVGRLWPQKRIRDLLWAIELLGHMHPETHLLVVGEGPERLRLERFMRQIHLKRAHLIGERGDVPRLLAHSACLWLASGYEGMPNAVMEAMAAGLPLVATDIPGCRNLVVPGETGYLVPVGDRTQFAKLTNKLLNEPEFAKRLGQAAKERITREFTAEKMVERYTVLYEEVLAKHAG